jgi:hypothetical protein
LSFRVKGLGFEIRVWDSGWRGFKNKSLIKFGDSVLGFRVWALWFFV